MRYITAQFKDGREVIYTMAIYKILVLDEDIICIYDSETGEILFCRQ